MKAILPIAGSGTRMYPLGVTTPKALIPILNKPLIMWSLEALQKNGITEAVLVVNNGPFGQQIKEYFETHPMENFTVHFSLQEEQLGTAHVVQMARDFFQAGEEFVFLYGDDLYGPENIAQVLKTNGLAITGKKVTDPEKWGIFQTNQDNHLVKVVEKPQEFVGDLANIGCMKLNTRVFDLYSQLKPSERGEYELTDTLQLLCQETTISVLPSVDYWIPVGYPWHILDATEFLAPQIDSNIEGTVEENVTIKGKVILPKSSTIKAGTYIEGNVVVGENVSIGPNAYLRENVCLGDNSKVGFSVEIKNSIIGQNSRVPHLSYLADSILGKNVNFACQAVSANVRHDNQEISSFIKGQLVSTGRHKFGTVIGDNVKLGIGTKIYPGRKIGPSQTTRPGEIVDKDLVEK